MCLVCIPYIEHLVEVTTRRLFEKLETDLSFAPLFFLEGVTTPQRVIHFFGLGSDNLFIFNYLLALVTYLISLISCKFVINYKS